VFSRRSSFDRQPNALYLAQSAREPTRPVLDLTLSNPTLAGLSYPEQAILAALADPADLRYEPHSFGAPAAREALAAGFRERGLAVQADQIALTSSTSEAYAMLFKLLCDAGDEVLIPAPSYPLLAQLAALEAVELVPYPLTYAGEWQLVASEIERRRTSRTRALIVVNPNNPTGSFLKRDELDVLAGLGLPIVSDEVFADYPLLDDPRRVDTALRCGSALVFALGGLSKSAGLPQLKLAWTTVGGPAALVREALARLELILDVFLSPGVAVQRALPRLLEIAATTRAAIRRRIAANLDELRAKAAGSEVSLLRVEGGWCAVVRLPSTHSEEHWVLGLLEHGVLVQPGWFYDFGDEPYVVLSLLPPEPVFASGLARLLDWVRIQLARG
jgi:hypothetical protein